MSIPDRNLPIYIDNFTVSIKDGQKNWASLCLNPTDTDFRRVWNFVLSANMFPTNEVQRHITYDLSAVQKTFFIDFEGPVQGFITWKGKVWDASRYMSYTYTETETTSVILFEFSIPFCPTFTKVSPILFDIYVNDAATCGNCPSSVVNFPTSVLVPNVTCIKISDTLDTTYQVVSLPTTQGASALSSTTLCSTTGTCLFVNLPPQTVQGNIYTINFFLDTVKTQQILIQYTFQEPFTIYFCYFQGSDTSGWSGVQPSTSSSTTDICTLTPNPSPNCGQVTVTVSYSTTYTVNIVNDQTKGECGDNVLTSNTLNCQTTLTNPQQLTTSNGSYTCTQLNITKTSGDQSSDVLTLNGNAYLLTIVPKYNLTSLVKLYSPINAQYRFQCEAFSVQNTFAFNTSQSQLLPSYVYNGTFPSLKIFSQGPSVLVSPTIEVNNLSTPLVQFNMSGTNITCTPRFTQGTFSSVVFVFDSSSAYTVIQTPLEFTPQFYPQTTTVEKLTVVFNTSITSSNVASGIISGANIEGILTQLVFGNPNPANSIVFTKCFFQNWGPVNTSFENVTFTQCHFQSCSFIVTTASNVVFDTCNFTLCGFTFQQGNSMTLSNSIFSACPFSGNLSNPTLDPNVLVIFSGCNASASQSSLNINDNGLLLCSGTVWTNGTIYTNPCTWYTLSYTYQSTQYFLGVSSTPSDNTPTIQTTVSSLCYWYINTDTNTIQNVSRSKDNNTNERSFLIMAGTNGANLNPGMWDACSPTDGQYTNGQCRWIFTQENYLKNQYQENLGKVFLNGNAQRVFSDVSGSTVWMMTQVS